MMEGRAHACIKCDWRPTGEVTAYYVYDTPQSQPCIWLRCASCKSPGFKHPGSEVVYTWDLNDPPTSLPVTPSAGNARK